MEETTNSVTEDPAAASAPWDHSTHREFYEYYAKQSAGEETIEHFRRQRDFLLQIPNLKCRKSPLAVADIGCGAGTFSMIWAELGHKVTGLDINESLIELASSRAKAAGFDVEFGVGSATSIPWPDGIFDVCMAPELLEHVADWNSCVDEFTRILKPNGVLFLSTTNKLCPVQVEFNLPLYSWYPGPIKRHYERLAITSRPEIANYAKYPAVNWFTFYELRRALRARGFQDVMDRFDIAAARGHGTMKNGVLTAIRGIAPLRWLGHVGCSSTILAAVKAG